MPETRPTSPDLSEAPKKEPEPPEIFIDHRVLYHGSSTSGIKELAAAQEDTAGYGVYLVDNPEDAAGYAKRRSRRGQELTPIIYEAEIKNLKLVNLNNADKLEEVMQDFAKNLKQSAEAWQNAPWYLEEAKKRSLELIEQGLAPGQVKKAVGPHTQLFSLYLLGLGYDGLKTHEGGEGNDVGNHDTYLIFDPHKVTIKTEQPAQ